uniref:Uncharacterized protein n=1 Tax=Rhizophora mucronata TaxID=61149 RepID=A0A2P2PWT9_RHIMU
MTHLFTCSLIFLFSTTCKAKSCSNNY